MLHTESDSTVRADGEPVLATADAARSRRGGSGQRKSTKRSKISRAQLMALEEVRRPRRTPRRRGPNRRDGAVARILGTARIGL